MTVSDLANAKSYDGLSALHAAAWRDHLPDATTAIDLVVAEDKDGYTALDAWISALPCGNTEHLEVKFKEKFRQQHCLSLVSLLNKTTNQGQPLGVVKKIAEKFQDIDPATTAQWLTKRILEAQESKWRD